MDIGLKHPQIIGKVIEIDNRIIEKLSLSKKMTYRTPLVKHGPKSLNPKSLSDKPFFLLHSVIYIFSQLVLMNELLDPVPG